MILKLVDRRALQDWDAYRKSVVESTSVDLSESPDAQSKRIRKLEADPEKWFKYYFPKFAYADPADFHKAATRRLLSHDRWYEVRAWSRELAKSTRAMMESLYMTLTGKRFNVLLISNSNDNAVRLLAPFKINLESNQRIVHDYGDQQALGSWETGEFITKKGVSFRAIGAGQSPRGTRNEEKRVDLVLIDDFDTDEECKNPRIIKQKWEWLEQAVMPTVSVSGKYTFLFLGNIIAKDCCIVRASKKASHFEKINIRDKHGVSTWPQKNSEKDIDDILSLISYISQQKEFFNNPITEGTVFTEMYFKRLRPLKFYRFLVCYIDPSYKATSKNDYKAIVLMGKHGDEYHIHKAFVKQCTTAKMVEALIDFKNYVGSATNVYFFMEEVFLQDIIIQEVYQIAKEMRVSIPLKGDDRAKPDKFTRIESNLEPLNRNGKLWLNEEFKDDPGMQTLAEQFVALEPGSKSHDDGPDAAEGAKWIIDFKTSTSPADVTVGRRAAQKNRL
jgi:hypothetical protein